MLQRRLDLLKHLELGHGVRALQHSRDRRGAGHCTPTHSTAHQATPCHTMPHNVISNQATHCGASAVLTGARNNEPMESAGNTSGYTERTSALTPEKTIWGRVPSNGGYFNNGTPTSCNAASSVRYTTCGCTWWFRFTCHMPQVIHTSHVGIKTMVQHRTAAATHQ